MEKDPCKKFCGVLISSHKVMKLQSFESGLNDVIPQMYKTFHPWFSFHIFLILWRKNVLHSSMVILTISYQLMKLQSFE